MTKFEYCIYNGSNGSLLYTRNSRAEISNKDFVDTLGTLGNEEWELVSIENLSKGITYFFKRELK